MRRQVDREALGDPRRPPEYLPGDRRNRVGVELIDEPGGKLQLDVGDAVDFHVDAFVDVLDL